jgi:hypothetical protein
LWINNQDLQINTDHIVFWTLICSCSSHPEQMAGWMLQATDNTQSNNQMNTASRLPITDTRSLA